MDWEEICARESVRTALARSVNIREPTSTEQNQELSSALLGISSIERLCTLAHSLKAYRFFCLRGIVSGRVARSFGKCHEYPDELGETEGAAERVSAADRFAAI